MADVVRLVPKNDETKISVVDFLRKCADAIESGEEDPAHKAILVLYEERGDMFCTRGRYHNVSTLERNGLLAMASHDALNADG
jgi:hypothetical protein